MKGDVLHAWLAGLIDGEGSVMLGRRTFSGNTRQVPRNPHYRAVVSIANCDYRLMEALVLHTGVVRVYEHRVSNTAKSHNPRKNRQWTWRLASEDIRLWMPRVRPFLVLKGEQADLLLEALVIKQQLTATKGQRWLSPDQCRGLSVRLSEIYAEIRALNTRGREVPDTRSNTL